MAAPNPPTEAPETHPAGYFLDPVSGEKVFARDGMTFVKAKGSDELWTVPNAQAGQKLLTGDFVPATADDVHARDLEKKHGGVVGKIKTGAESLAAGAFDAAVSPVTGASSLYSAATGKEDALKDVSGRKLLEN